MNARGRAARFVRATPFVLVALCGCLTLDGFLFNPKAVEAYDFDADDPCDEQLLGDLEEAKAAIENREPRCHASLIPAELRHEGFIELDDRRVHYVYARADGAQETIFYSHGTRWHLGWYWARVELMWALGYNVMIYDYPQYGRSTGDVLDEGTVYENADAVLRLLVDLPGVDPERIFLYGYSLGGGPTFELAARSLDDDSLPRPAGIISEAAFCSVEFLVQDGAFIDLPASFVADNRFDNCAKLSTISERAPEIPVMLIHGDADDFIVPAHADALLSRADGMVVHHHRAAGAAHSDIPVVASDYETWLTDFIALLD